MRGDKRRTLRCPHLERAFAIRLARAVRVPTLLLLVSPSSAGTDRGRNKVARAAKPDKREWELSLPRHNSSRRMNFAALPRRTIRVASALSRADSTSLLADAARPRRTDVHEAV